MPDVETFLQSLQSQLLKVKARINRIHGACPSRLGQGAPDAEGCTSQGGRRFRKKRKTKRKKRKKRKTKKRRRKKGGTDPAIDECPICLEKLKGKKAIIDVHKRPKDQPDKKEDQKKGADKHYFHLDCAAESNNKAGNDCPSCRKPMTYFQSLVARLPRQTTEEDRRIAQVQAQVNRMQAARMQSAREETRAALLRESSSGRGLGGGKRRKTKRKRRR